MKSMILLLACLLIPYINIHAQALCVIDGLPVPDSVLCVTTDEMKSDSAKQIIARRSGLISPAAIESIQIVDKDFLSAKNVIVCSPPTKDIVLITTNSLAKIQFVIDNKLVKPLKLVTIIELKLFPNLLSEVLPRRIKQENIKSLDILIPEYDTSPERRPTVIINTKKNRRR